MKHLFFLLLLGLSVLQARSQERHAGFGPVHYLTHEWLMYNHDEEVYVPYRNNPDQEFRTFTLLVDMTRYPRAYLLVRTPVRETNIFIDHALSRVSKKPEWLIYSLDSLRSLQQRDTLFFSMFTAATPAEVTAYIGFPSGNPGRMVVEKEASQREVVRLTPRSVSGHNSGVAAAFVLSLVVMSFVSNNYFRVYGKYYSLKDVLSTRVKENLFIIGKPLDRPSLFFVILLSMVTGFFVLMLQFWGLSVFEESFIFQSGNTVTTNIINFLKLCLLVFVLFVLKFFFLNITGKLFNLGRVTDLHYFKAIQCSLFFYSILLLVALILYNTYVPLPQNIEKYLFILMAAFYSGRGILIYFTINRESNVKFLYLFSYLCIAEALPIILGMRFLFL